MAQGYLDFTNGQVLTAAQLEDYCELQGIMRFASAAARTTALSGVLIEGLMCYLVDLNVIQVYSGSAWSTIGPVHGTLTAWAPAVVQGVTPTVAVGLGVYQRIGRRVEAWFVVTLTSSGTAANLVTVTLPVAAAAAWAADYIIVGEGDVVDQSLQRWPSQLTIASTTTMKFKAHALTNAPPTFVGLAGGTTAALVSGDIISGHISYEAGADA